MLKHDLETLKTVRIVKLNPVSLDYDIARGSDAVSPPL